MNEKEFLIDKLLDFFSSDEIPSDADEFCLRFISLMAEKLDEKDLKNMLSDIEKLHRKHKSN